MNRKKFLIVLPVVVIFILVGLILWKDRPLKGSQSQSFTIAKAWWPAWDTFQIGAKQREETVKSFRTMFSQSEDMVSALNDFKTGKADAATLTIYEAILAASEGVPLKIVLLLDYTTGSDGVVAKKSVRSLNDLKGKRIGVEQGTIAHFTTLKALEKAGFDRT